MSDALRLATCTFQEFAPHMGTPVRTTAGHPRFSLSYQLGGHARLVTPSWNLVRANLAADAYEFQYRRQLTAAGVDAIRDELTAIAGAFDLDAPAVLLCFDRLNKPGQWCHRTMLAAWWTEHTGDLVPELGAQPARPNPTLFDF
ncbi:hypothetical protein GCM10010387_15840 [Streptomyces inusitatus]|uniref:DUF488 domain-containing protein n=1 Tax=Streptomyces inusitatus TaxID=68221 RepID=A0A918PWY4_9ACTN|nr:hypothetical protein [Streptomyces inusitatus]GGZ23485.1 hypothetical protein GCM10010387_15840 [Streptomyces inusitatus]